MHGQSLRAAGEQEKIHYGLFGPLQDAIFFFCHLEGQRSKAKLVRERPYPAPSALPSRMLWGECRPFKAAAWAPEDAPLQSPLRISPTTQQSRWLRRARQTRPCGAGWLWITHPVSCLQ